MVLKFYAKYIDFPQNQVYPNKSPEPEPVQNSISCIAYPVGLP